MLPFNFPLPLLPSQTTDQSNVREKNCALLFRAISSNLVPYKAASMWILKKKHSNCCLCFSSLGCHCTVYWVDWGKCAEVWEIIISIPVALVHWMKPHLASAAPLTLLWCKKKSKSTSGALNVTLWWRKIWDVLCITTILFAFLKGFFYLILKGSMMPWNYFWALFVCLTKAETN